MDGPAQPRTEVIEAPAGRRRALDAGNPAKPGVLVGGEPGGRIVGEVEAVGEDPGVLERHRRALGEEGQHRVTGVPEQGKAAVDPARQRRVVEEAPEKASVYRVEQGAGRPVPAGEGTAQGVGIILAAPPLPGPGRALLDGDEVDERPVAQRIGDEVTALAHRHARRKAGKRGGDTLGRDRPAPGDVAREARRLRREAAGPQGGADAVRGDDDRRLRCRAIVERQRSGIAGRPDRHHPRAEVKGCPGLLRAGAEDVEQVGAMDVPVGTPVAGDGRLAQRHPGNRAPAAAMVEKFHRLGKAGADLCRVTQAERLEHRDPVRRNLEPGANLGEGGSLLVDVDPRMALGERGRRGEAADAGTDDGDLLVRRGASADLPCPLLSRSARRLKGRTPSPSSCRKYSRRRLPPPPPPRPSGTGIAFTFALSPA